MRQLVILNFCFATGMPALSGNASSDPSAQQKYNLFNKALLAAKKTAAYANATEPHNQYAGRYVNVNGLL